MKRALFLVLLLALPAFASATKLEKHPARPPVSLDFRVAEPAGTAGTVELPLKGSRESLHLRKEPVLSVKDLRGAEAVKDGAGRQQVLLLLKTDGATRFGKATGDNLGKRLGVVLDGKLVLAPEIKMKMSTDKMFLGIDLEPAQAERLVARLKAATSTR